MDITLSAHMSMKQAIKEQGDEVPDFAHSENQRSIQRNEYNSPASPPEVQVKIDLDMLADDEKVRSMNSFILQTGNSNNAGCSVTRTKRKRCVQGSSEDVVTSLQHHRKRLMKGTKVTNAPLACPFAKHDPIASPGCWDFAAENLARLKEHLLRRHERPYCPICLEPFDNYDARDVHVRERICHEVHGKQRGPWMESDVISKVRQRTKKGETATEGWQRIFSALFPDERTIPLPYVEDIGQLYMKRIRKTIAEEFIEFVHSRLDPWSTDGVVNEPSAMKAACISQLSGIANQYITRGKGTGTESNVKYESD